MESREGENVSFEKNNRYNHFNSNGSIILFFAKRF